MYLICQTDRQPTNGYDTDTTYTCTRTCTCNYYTVHEPVHLTQACPISVNTPSFLVLTSLLLMYIIALLELRGRENLLQVVQPSRNPDTDPAMMSSWVSGHTPVLLEGTHCGGERDQWREVGSRTIINTHAHLLYLRLYIHVYMYVQHVHVHVDDWSKNESVQSPVHEHLCQVLQRELPSCLATSKRHRSLSSVLQLCCHWGQKQCTRRAGEGGGGRSGTRKSDPSISSNCMLIHHMHLLFTI